MGDYDLRFHKAARREWEKLDSNIQIQFTAKLRERLVNPRVQSDKVRGLKDAYKIKLRTAGYRLVYQVIDTEVVVLVLAIGKRDKLEVYETAKGR